MLRASDQQVETALSRVEADVAAQQAAVDAARQAVAAAERAAADARRAEAEKTAEVGALDRRVTAMAIDAYVNPASTELFSALQAEDLDEASRKREYLQLRQNRGRAVLDAAKSAREDLAVRRVAAERAQQAAESRRSRVEVTLGQLNDSLRRQQTFANEVEARLDAALSEAASLEALDRQLAAEITRRNELLAQRTRLVVAPRPPRASRDAPVRTSADVPLTTVRGITVNSAIADELEQLLAAAEANGFVFSGGGYRDSSAQVAARRANCGTSDYAIYEMPPSQCSPPTARPGTSMHEQGLAVDFTWQGRIISSRSSPAFQWLADNAERFGSGCTTCRASPGTGARTATSAPDGALAEDVQRHRAVEPLELEVPGGDEAIAKPGRRSFDDGSVDERPARPRSDTGPSREVHDAAVEIAVAREHGAERDADPQGRDLGVAG